jgi:hypothetical protein
MRLIHRTLLILLAIGVVASSGCIYWRLLKFKHQLDDFSEHFALSTDGSTTLMSLHPILGIEDVEGLMEIAPSERYEDAGGSWLVYAFAKEPADGTPPLVYRLGFEKGLLRQIRFPEQFDGIYPGPVLRELLESLGAADVDRGDRVAHGQMLRQRIAEHLPDRTRLEEVLGQPSHHEILSGNEEQWHYDYRPITSSAGKVELKRRAYGRFRFSAAGDLVAVAAGIGKHKLEFDIEGAPASEQ